ncbi:MAG: hypothetical protein JXR07_20450, partial [Reichenbachiella sp.]
MAYLKPTGMTEKVAMSATDLFLFSTGDAWKRASFQSLSDRLQSATFQKPDLYAIGELNIDADEMIYGTGPNTYGKATLTATGRSLAAAADAAAARTIINAASSSHTHDAIDITSGELASARISEASVTQHQAALAVSFSQISDVAFSTDDTMAAATDAMIYSGLATKTYIADQIAALVASSPAALDTLNELAAALGDDPNFATTTSTALGNRLRVDTNAQGLSGTQQGYGRTNLGLGSMALASSDDYLLLTGGTLTGGIDITSGQLTITN